MYWVVHPRRPRDFPRAEGNLEVGGDVQPNSSRFEAVYGHSLIIKPSLGMYQEIHPCRVSSIDSVKINTSLPKSRSCDDAKLRRGYQYILESRSHEVPMFRCCRGCQKFSTSNATKLRSYVVATLRDLCIVHPALSVYCKLPTV